MSDPGQLNAVSGVRTVIEHALERLKVLSAVLDIYAKEEDAEKLRDIAAMLEQAAPLVKPTPNSGEFIVKATFRVSRMQVAGLLSIALAASTRCKWCNVVDMTEPAELKFRANERLILRLVDYPLNEGGALAISGGGAKPDTFRLDLHSIANGLEQMASKFPRHFADFLSESGDAITADVFLQCCLFGDVIYE